MPNILIRNLSQQAVDRIDAAAADLGLSRNEYLRRRFEQPVPEPGGRTVTAEDWKRSAETLPTWRTRPSWTTRGGDEMAPRFHHPSRTRLLGAHR